jgi:tRNA(Ile)-lysidine synthase
VSVDVEQVRDAIRADRLLGDERALVAMLSGGRDSVCLLDVAVALRGSDAVRALHVNYGLRAAAVEEERYCVALCEQLGVELDVVRAEHGAPGAPGAPVTGLAAGSRGIAEPDDPRGEAHGEVQGNLQAWARDVRYEAARALAARHDALIATGHTASDQIETILYRLAASPGRRALLGMAAAEGRLVRPLLGLTREQTAAYCEARGLRWCDDESNADERFARVRVRERLVPALRAVHPAAEANVLRTASLLREETELLDGLVDAELAGAGSIALARLRALPAGLARMVVIRLAENAVGSYVPQAGERVHELLALGEHGGRAELHVGGQARAVVEAGALSMHRLAPRQARKPPPVED